MKHAIPNQNEFTTNSITGSVKVTHHVLIDLFDLNIDLKFFLLPSLNSFHGILGADTLKALSAVIHVHRDVLNILGNTNIYLKRLHSENVNQLGTQRLSLDQILKSHSNLFAKPNEKLTYVSNVKGEIRTVNNDAVYSRQYPYPMALKGEIDKQVNELLANGIIRPSRSPYNAPLWIVPKGKGYRLVIDYKKLNSVTVPDRYPIPEINLVLSNLGKNSFFSVIDLKSGFHQIPLKEADIEKTAFSINNGKYEFVRLPFGFKNSPAIFQRTLDDILRDHIGKSCYIYIDDIIIFGKNEMEHLENLRLVFNTLNEANMKVNLEKCKFLQTEVEFLGFVVSVDGIKSDPLKIVALSKMQEPKTLKQLRSFLGLSSYYRRFMKDYASIAKPLTQLLRGPEGHVSRSESQKKIIQLSADAIKAFQVIKASLISNEVLLSHPDFSKPFDLTTDASNYALAGVLSQGDRPITFISRTLSVAEENYSASEKEMLAIVWSLKSLNKYLYGATKVNIFTDHQPLTYALSNKNTNSKLKRWMSFLEEYNYELKYKPGKENVVADAFSRLPTNQVNALSSIHSDDSSSHGLIQSVDSPINAYKNQIVLSVGNLECSGHQLLFACHNRRTIVKKDYSEQDLIAILKRYLNPQVINGVFAPERVMGQIQRVYPLHFSGYKIRFCRTLVEDVQDIEKQNRVMLCEHRRAHRNADENKKQIIRKYYFPNLNAKMRNIVKNCSVCKECKYDRHPNNTLLNSTPIPTYSGQIVHIDIFSTNNVRVLTAVDKFSKYAVVKVIESRSVEHIRRPLQEILYTFGGPESVVIDNEKSLNSISIVSMLQDDFNIQIYCTPPYRSEVNGQVERFHSTLAEIMRCLKVDGRPRTFTELLERAVHEYNCTIHSTTNKKPVELLLGRLPNITPEQFENIRLKNVERITKKQQEDIGYHNKSKTAPKQYAPGDIIYVKNNKRLGTKLTQRYKKEIVKENNNSTVVTTKNHVVHKNNIRN